MFQMKERLSNRERPIEICLVGIGKMGKSLADRLLNIEGFNLRVIINRSIDNIYTALQELGVKKEDMVELEDPSDINQLHDHQIGITSNEEITFNSEIIDVFVEATGNASYGAHIASNALANKKHVVTFNVECDAVVGPSLYKLAQKNGVIYTGAGGDEPAAIVELIDFAYGLGLVIIAAGKGKNNPKDIHITNEELLDRARAQKLSPGTLTSFIDATNTMLELCSVSNATGITTDKMGAHGIHSDLESLGEKLKLKSEGGIINGYPLLDYVHGIAPGVFVAVKADTDSTREILEYVGMGEGPIYTIYRPYHLCSIETPRTIYNAVELGVADIAPIKGQVSDVVAVSKRDIRAGEYIAGIGSNDTYGTITTHTDCKDRDLLPIGLITDKTVAIVDIKRDTHITRDMVQLDSDATIVKIRDEQDNG